MPATTPALAFLRATLPEPRNHPVQRTDHLIDVLRAHAGRDAVHRRLRHALHQKLVDAELRTRCAQGPRLSWSAHRRDSHWREAEGTRRNRNGFALLHARLSKVETAASRLNLAETLRPWLRCKVFQPAQQRTNVRIERLGQNRMQALQVKC